MSDRSIGIFQIDLPALLAYLARDPSGPPRDALEENAAVAFECEHAAERPRVAEETPVEEEGAERRRAHTEHSKCRA